MILLDCGNSSIKAQSEVDGRVQASFSTRYRQDWLARLQYWMRDFEARRCFLASVLDTDRQQKLDACLRQNFEQVSRFVSQAESLGLVNAYDQPHRLGADRWMALVGAAGLVASDCLVIDAGSAITLDLLRADGRHLGGAILAGINTSPTRFRQIFSHIDFQDPRIAETDEPGCSTEAAIHIDYSGNSLTYLAKLVTRWKQKLDANAPILIAGGDAAAVQAALAPSGRLRPDLVFVGISRLARA